MNALLGIAKITSNRKIKKWCAIKRYRQYEAKWAKERPPLVMVAIESTDEAWNAI
jgi:hypothetical protein